ncbi:MAG: hypothetical protein P8183_09365 [Anaerolineae bacterium]
MDFFPRSTIVSPLTRIRQERLLPGDGNIVAKVGQEVLAVQVVARAPLSHNFQIVPASKTLGISPEELSESLLVTTGMMVDQGTPLVRKKGLRKGLDSPVEGTLYDVANGNLVFRQVSDFVELRAFARGRVVSHLGNRGVVLEISGSLIQAAWDSGKEGFGTIHVAVETAVAPFTSDQIDTDVAKTVLVTGRINQAEALEHAERAGISGLIAGSITADLLPLARSVSFPVFITNGIGQQGMAGPILDLLQRSEAREVALFMPPRYQQGQRPKIIIPLEASSGKALPPNKQPLTVGQTARIIRPPPHNQIGTVARLYKKKQLTAVGTRVYGAYIKLPDDTVVFVPIVNIEAII